MFTRWPALRAWKRGSTIFMPYITPCTLMSTWRLAVASSSSTNGPSCMMPALFTSTSTLPSCSSVASRKRLEGLPVGHVERQADRRPGTPSAARLASASSRSPIATFIPRAAQACAVASPMPRAAPVMATTLP